MYIRKSIRLYKGKTYTNYVLVESVMTPKGPRQKTICSLGDLSPRRRQEWLKLAHKIEDALVGQSDLLDANEAEVADIVRRVRARRASDHAHADPASPSLRQRASGGALITVDPSRVTTEQHREAGPVHVGYQFWQRLELDRILNDCKLSPTVRRLACVMTLNRLIAPAAEHAMPDWIRRTALADILGADFDKLEEDPAKRGHSRDHRADCKQLVVGLVLNRDGFAITHEIFPGNAQDRTTLATMLDRLGERVRLEQGAIVVIDRGMAFDANIADIKKRKLHYIVASRQPERDRWLADFDDTDGFTPVLREPSPLNPAQKKTMIEVKTCSGEGDEQTYVLCRSEQRIAKDRAIRTKQEVRLIADIEKLSRRIAEGKLVKPAKINQAIGRLQERYPRVARYYKLCHEPETPTLVSEFDADKHRKAEQLDGCYLLKTDHKNLSGDEIWRIYTLLTRAENAFRDMKSPLAVRPIFHHLEPRTESHIFLCLLAYHLLIAIEKTLLDQGIHTSWTSLRDTLKTHQVCTVVLPTSDGSCLRIRKAATPEPDVQQLYQKLAVSPQVMAPQHTWSQPPYSD